MELTREYLSEYMDKSLNGLEKRLDKKLDNLENKFERRFEKIDQRFDELETNLTNKIDVSTGQLARIIETTVAKPLEKHLLETRSAKAHYA